MRNPHILAHPAHCLTIFFLIILFPAILTFLTRMLCPENIESWIHNRGSDKYQLCIHRTPFWCNVPVCNVALYELSVDRGDWNDPRIPITLIENAAFNSCCV
jgi:hypothetical protein